MVLNKLSLLIQKFFRQITKDVFHTGLTNIARLFTGPVVMVLIPLFLTKQIQGYWFTFSSISALSVFADLGFTTIVGQFAAHEFARLHYTANGTIDGDKIFLTRLASFFRFILKWAMSAVVITYPVIFGVGYFIMHGEATSFKWIIPWIIFLVSGGILFFLNIINAFFEGCNRIADSQKIGFISVITNFSLIALILLSGFHLYALAYGALGQCLIRAYLINLKFGKSIKQLRFEKADPHNWRPEVLNLLWRYAISWSSGYFIFQLFTPVAFKFYGSEVAGQVGITISLVTAIFAFSNIWMYVANPQMNMFVSLKDWGRLDRLFKKQLKLAVITFISGGLACLVAFSIIPEKWQITQRFMKLDNISLLLVAWLLQLLINSMAMYLRAHKEEPLVIPSLVLGIFTGVSTILVALFLPSKFIFTGFFLSFFLGLPWVYSIYKKKKLVSHILTQY